MRTDRGGSVSAPSEISPMTRTKMAGDRSQRADHMKRTGPGMGCQTSRGSGMHGRTKTNIVHRRGRGEASSAQPHADGEVEDPDFRNVSARTPINSESSLRVSDDALNLAPTRSAITRQAIPTDTTLNS